MKFSSQQASDLYQLLRWRRDVRHFLTDPVPEDALERLRTAMDMAPSVGNCRPWRVIRVRDAKIRAAVRAEFTRCNELAAQSYLQERRHAYEKLKLAGLDKAPEHLAIFTSIDPQAGHGLGRTTMPKTVDQSTAMAIFSLWLAARAENLGLGMVSIVNPRAMEDLFKLGSQWAFSAYLCLGWPESEDDAPLLHRTRWQENFATVWETR